MENFREDHHQLALRAVARLAQALRDYGQKSPENHERELRVRDACGLKPWPLFERWLHCDRSKRGPAYSAVIVFGAVLRRELPKKDAAAIFAYAYKELKESDSAMLFSMHDHFNFPTKPCDVCGSFDNVTASALSSEEKDRLDLCDPCLRMLNALPNSESQEHLEAKQKN